MSWRRALGPASLSAILLGVSPTRAQTIVYDPTAVARLAAQAQTALKQLEQLKAQVAQGHLRCNPPANAVSNHQLFIKDRVRPGIGRHRRWR